MSEIIKMMQRIHSSRHFDSIVRYAKPLCSQLGINHFWYFHISNEGRYTYIGTHASWNEFCIAESLLKCFPCIRHPTALKTGISLMKVTKSEAFKKVIATAWEKFQINFSLNLSQSLDHGIEAFGFGTRISGFEADELFINELSFLQFIVNDFKKQNTTLFHFLAENSIDISSYCGNDFHRHSSDIILPLNRRIVLKEMGYAWMLDLTNEERKMIKLLASGFPASYIARQLHKSHRTVENYIMNIKGKSNCNKKEDLIKKCQEIVSTGLLDS